MISSVEVEMKTSNEIMEKLDVLANRIARKMILQFYLNPGQQILINEDHLIQMSRARVRESILAAGYDMNDSIYTRLTKRLIRNKLNTAQVDLDIKLELIKKVSDFKQLDIFPQVN